MVDLTGFRLTFQDLFGKNPSNTGSGIVPGFGPIYQPPQTGGWITHTPWNGDFNLFEDDGWSIDNSQTGSQPVLNLRARYEANKWRGTLLSSVDFAGRGFMQKYGYFECRMKVPSGAGTWPAFWLVGYPTPNIGDPRPEFDIIEFYGSHPNRYAANWHVWNPAGTGNLIYGAQFIDRGFDLSQDFHNYGGLVAPDFTIWYFDGEEVARISTPTAFKVPMGILVNYATQDVGFGLGGVGNPSYLLVDYVKAYALPVDYEYRGRTNVAPASAGTTASASSQFDYLTPPSGVIDGIAWQGWGNKQGWKSSDGAKPQWLQLDFTSPQTINQVDLFSLQDTWPVPLEPTPDLVARQYAIQDWDVQYWDEASASWRMTDGGSVIGNDRVMRSVKFTTITTSKIRVQMLRWLGNQARVMEVRAWTP